MAAPLGNWLHANGSDAGFEGAHHQPVAQGTGGAAVVVVVVFDLLEHGVGLVGASGVAQFAVAGVGGDRGGGGGDIPGAQLGPHVERFERLEAERFGADPNTPAHQRVKVDEHTVAQQVVDLVLTDAVAAGEPQQRGLLIRRVVVDVHVGVTLAALFDQRQEIDQRLAFRCPVVRPQRPELARGLQHAEQILQAPLSAVGSPQRVAFEVEEQVTGIGLRQQGQRLRDRRSRIGGCRYRVGGLVVWPVRSACRGCSMTAR